MKTVADICAKFPAGKRDTVARKLREFAVRVPKWKPGHDTINGRAVCVYSTQQVAEIMRHFEAHPLQNRRGAVALPPEERERRKAERAYKRKLERAEARLAKLKKEV